MPTTAACTAEHIQSYWEDDKNGNGRNMPAPWMVEDDGDADDDDAAHEDSDHGDKEDDDQDLISLS